MRSFLLLAALTLAPASAQTVTTIDARVQFPPIVQTAANLLAFLSQGVRVSFLTPNSQPAATLTQSGSIRITGTTQGATPVTQVQVMTPLPGTTQYVREIYPLAQPLDTSGPLSAQSIVVRAADGRKVPLMDVMGRQAAWAQAPGLQKKPGGLPPGQLKKLCRDQPQNSLCYVQNPTKQDQQHPGHGNGKH